MLFTLVDVILIAVILLFVIAGFFFGLIQGIGALAGLALGTWSAGRFYQPVADWLNPFLLDHETAARIIAFIAVFIVVNRLVAFVFYIINKIFKLISIVPFLSSINRLAGAVLGLVEGVLVIGLVVYIVAKFATNLDWIINLLNSSKVAHALVWLTGFLTALLPEAINKTVSIF